MKASPKCTECGSSLPVDTPAGYCPVCLLDTAIPLPEEDQIPAVAEDQARQIGDYLLGREIGAGAMGLVYEAVQVSLNRIVAVKTIRPEQASPLVLSRFRREAKVSARLEHPNIIPIYETGEDQGEPFLSMKLIRGETLRQKIKGKAFRLPTNPSKTDIEGRERTIARIVKKLAQAVHHAHERSVFHRDLKPANILVDSVGEPHLTDFGLAKVMEGSDDDLDALTLPGQVLGTPAYMAPEQASGDSVSACSEVYSLGVILYELLTGDVPFVGKDVRETLELVKKGNLKHPSVRRRGIGRNLETICLKCLQFDPLARYGSAQDLAKDLDNWLQGRPIDAERDKKTVVLMKWCRRNPVGIALIMSLTFGFTTALALSILLFFQYKRVDNDGEKLGEIASGQQTSQMEKIDSAWRDPETLQVDVSYRDLAFLLGEARGEFGNSPIIELTFGAFVRANPAYEAQLYAKSLLWPLEKQMADHLNRPVRFNLRLYKSRSGLIAAPSNDRPDLARLNVLSLLRTPPGSLQPLALEYPGTSCVFFSLSDSGITDLTQLRGRTLICGEPDDTQTLWAKYAMVMAGVDGPGTPNGLREYKEVARREIQPAYEITAAVERRTADVGVVHARHLYKRGGGKMREIGSFTNTPGLYAASSRLDPSLVKILGNALFSLDEESLGKLPGQALPTERTSKLLPVGDTLERVQEAQEVVRAHFGDFNGQKE